MAPAVPDVLARIVEHKQAGLPGKRARRAEWEDLADRAAGSRRDFPGALTGRAASRNRGDQEGLAEQGGPLRDFRPPEIARAYQSGGAAALSVLTDERFFQGSLADLQAARAATGLPVLRKDFTLDEIDVVEAAAHGADAILLIAGLLDAGSMRRLRELAARYGMAALVEVHNEADLDSAIESGAEILGVNNRDLHTFEVSIETSLRLARRMPSGTVKVSESGIRSSADVRRLMEAGYHAFLVGERLMKAPDPAAALGELRR